MRKISENKRISQQKLTIFVVLVTLKFETRLRLLARHQFPIHLFNYLWPYVLHSPAEEVYCLRNRFAEHPCDVNAQDKQQTCYYSNLYIQTTFCDIKFVPISLSSQGSIVSIKLKTVFAPRV